ncbi:MAG: radical SAM protein [Paludibacteraceae bacterium]|nr:radical SAM protein [Paludibacteraceae bacterium]
MQTAPFIAVARHRINLDGEGVVTLACFGGCPLRCKYCINPQCFEPHDSWKSLTAEQLYEQTKPDELYFLATRGGVTFGGGEPLLRTAFIREFRALCGDLWTLSVETSLNVPEQAVKDLLPVINHWIVDVKDMNPDIYASYTGKENTHVIQNLKLLAENTQPQHVTIRLPIIPNFNTETDRQKSIGQLRQIGFDKFDLFDYTIKK